MEIPPLDFLIHFDCDQPLEIISGLVKNEIEKLKTATVIQAASRWITVKKHESYDPERMLGEDGWFWYPYIIEVFYYGGIPTEKELNEQIVLARCLLTLLKEQNCKLYFVGDIENLL